MRPASQNAGVSSDDTSASFSISSSDKACDPGTVVVGMGFRANDRGAGEAGPNICQSLVDVRIPQGRESATYALPARQARADSAPEQGTYGPALRGRGGAQTARPLAQLTDKTKNRGRRSPRRVGSDDESDNAARGSRSPARAGEIAIRYSSRGAPMTRSSAQATKSRVLSGGSHPGLEGMGIRAIHPRSEPSPRVLIASPRPP